MHVSAGTVRPVTRYGAAVLHRPCARVDSFGAALEVLVEDMLASMYAATGVGWPLLTFLPLVHTEQITRQTCPLRARRGGESR